MNHRYSDANELDDYRSSGEREITLNAATILGIFFLLALICAVFFGFGYTLGRKSAPSPNAETLAAPAPVGAASSSSAKPSASSRTTNLTTRTTADTDTPPPNQIAQPRQAPEDTAAPDTTQQVSIPVTNTAPARRTPVETAPPPVASRPALAPSATTFVVQIAAVSHQEDAEVLRTALEPRGYHVNILRVPQDKLFHVQVGPFTNRKDADAMRQRLLNDGYNAIVK